MTERKKTRLFVVVFILLSTALVCWGYWRKLQIETKHEITVGRIYHYSYVGRGNGGGIWVDFKIEINRKEYNSSTRYLTDDFNCNNDFIGKTFPAVYNPDHPSISSILIIPSDFARYNYPFPDSLNWVKKYIK